MKTNLYRSSVGDIWQLGSNFLYCGDSESEIHLDKQIVTHGPAQIVFTDPPYNFARASLTTSSFLSDENKGGRKKYDDLNEENMIDFKPSRFLYLLPGYFKTGCISAFIFCNKDLLPDYLGWVRDHRDSDGRLKNLKQTVLVWKKPSPIPIGNAHYPDLEYIVYIRKNGTWNDMSKAPLADRKRCLPHPLVKTGEHPTMKPVDLIANQIRLTTDVGGLVYDPYVGSGSTIIACEQTGRRCIATELYPKWCDVAISRWEGETGKDAWRIHHDPPISTV